MNPTNDQPTTGPGLLPEETELKRQQLIEQIDATLTDLDAFYQRMGFTDETDSPKPHDGLSIIDGEIIQL